MFEALKGFFGGHSSIEKSLYGLEVNDEELNKEVAKLILELQEKIKIFENQLDSTNIYGKEQELQTLYGFVLQIKTMLEGVQSNVEKIISLEMQYKTYFIIKDDEFLLDKREQIKKLEDKIHLFLSIVQQRPSYAELREELFGKMTGAVREMSISINRIIKDDGSLRVIYKKLSEI